MVEVTSKTIDLGQLRAEVRGPIRFLAEKLLQDIPDNLESLCVVGSALTSDFHPKRSDINTVLVVTRRSHELLQVLAGYGSKMGKLKLRAPLLMTKEYIAQSLDVFGVEFLDFQLNHTVVCGADPLAELTIRKEDVRLQCERELKTALIQLRQGYIRALGKPKLVSGLLVTVVGQLVVLLRAMLWLVDVQRPREALPTLEKSAERFEFNGDAVGTLLRLKQQHRRPGSDRVEGMFENLYQVVEQLSREVDQL